MTMTDETLMTETASTPEGEASSEATEANTETVENPSEQPSEAATEEKTGEPVEYTFDLPEGVTMADDTLEGLKSLAGDLKLDQDGANKVKDLGVQMLQKWEAAQSEALEAMKSDWAASAKSDAEIGGAKFDENIAGARSAMEKFATPELKSFLEESGLGNHPEMIRMFWKLNNQISDDALVSGNPAPTPKTRAEVLFGS
jgi:hypothetical protein